jgi:hypothetical protein
MNYIGFWIIDIDKCYYYQTFERYPLIPGVLLLHAYPNNPKEKHKGTIPAPANYERMLQYYHTT